MKVISFELQNFGSYRHVKFDMSDSGLTLIHGPTGSGKSTLCDAIPWVLFGRTSKDGAVDEVRSWGSTERTYGHVVLDMGDYSLWIARTRAPNDLYYIIDGVWEHPKRGKDLADTQRLINELLGFDHQLYLSGAYFHEFSQTAQFFTTTAKIRRQIMDQLADLSFAKDLQTKVLESNKKQSRLKDALTNGVKDLEDDIIMLSDYIAAECKKAMSWNDRQMSKKTKCEQDLNLLSDSIQPPEKFTTTKARLTAKLKALPPGKCDTCGAPKASKEREELLNSIHEVEKRIMRNQELISKSNRIAFELESLNKEQNTHGETAEKLKQDLEKASESLAKTQTSLNQASTTLSDGQALEGILATFRAVLLQNTVDRLQDTTNSLLTKHFDGEIRVAFTIEAADKMDVEIAKDGNKCVYTQLSKGQRQLLKLCFAVAVMKTIAVHHSVQFNSLWFDEALDGLSDQFKLKAFNLFNELSLEYKNVFVVEHSSELKAMFDSKIEIQMINGHSEINEKT